MELRQTAVSRCLDKKLLIFGFEVMDLMLIFFVMALLNFIFGSSSSKMFFVWLPSLALAAALRLGKKGKPDMHLVHLIRFQIAPGRFEAFLEPSIQKPFKNF